MRHYPTEHADKIISVYSLCVLCLVGWYVIRFYTAEVAIALLFLHSRGVVYRSATLYTLRTVAVILIAILQAIINDDYNDTPLCKIIIMAE